MAKPSQASKRILISVDVLHQLNFEVYMSIQAVISNSNTSASGAGAFSSTQRPQHGNPHLSVSTRLAPLRLLRWHLREPLRCRTSDTGRVIHCHPTTPIQ